MKLIIFSIIFGITLVLNPIPSQAMYLFDTGNPTLAGGGILSKDSWWGARFSLTEQSQITGIESWINPGNWSGSEPTINPGNVYFGIYINVETEMFLPNYPDLGAYYIRENYIHPVNTHTAGWYGVSNINFPLDPGTYWIVIEVPIDSEFEGLVGFTPPHPFEMYSRYNATDAYGSKGAWEQLSNNDTYSFRLAGNSLEESPTVPEPSTIVLFTTGLFGVFVRRRFRD